MSLTEKQERFALEYVQDYNGTQAAIRAGYSEHTAAEQASRLLKNVQIAERVQELGNATADELGITKRWLLEKLRESVETNFPRFEIVVDMKGNPVAVTLGNPAASNKALELLMKHAGHLVERIQHEGGIDITINGVPIDSVR